MNPKLKIDETKLTPEQRDKLDNYRAAETQLTTLGDIATMVQTISTQLHESKQSGELGKVGALLVDMRDALTALKDQEAPESPDYAKPVVEAVAKLERVLSASIKAIDVKPTVQVDAPQVNVPPSNIDLKGVEKILKTDLPKAFEQAIKLVPKAPETDFQPLLDAWEGISEQLLSIENAARAKFSPGSIKVNNAAGSPIPITAPSAIPVSISSGNPTTISATHTDTSPATQNITVVDSASSTATGANAQSIIIGTPTAGSVASFTLSGYATIRIEVSGIWTGTLAAEQSIDGGTTWVSLGVHQASYTTSTFIAGFVGGASVAGATNFRMRATAAVTGTAIVRVTESVNPQSVYIANAAPSGNVISTNNSYSANLLAGAIFTGTSEDVSNFAEMRITVTASHASATDGLSIQQSTDNVNWDIIDIYTIPAATGKTFVVPRQAKWFRIVYTNGGTNTTFIRLSSLLNRMGTEPSSQRASDGYSNENDLQEVWAFNSVFNGTTWDRRRGDITSGAWVSVKGGPMPAGTALNTYAVRVTTNTTTTPTSSTAYISSIVITTEVGGTTSTVTIRDKQGTPQVLVNGLTTTAASLSPTVINFQTPVKMTSGIDVITAGAVAGTVDVWVNYYA